MVDFILELHQSLKVVLHHYQDGAWVSRSRPISKVLLWMLVRERSIEDEQKRWKLSWQVSRQELRTYASVCVHWRHPSSRKQRCGYVVKSQEVQSHWHWGVYTQSYKTNDWIGEPELRGWRLVFQTTPVEFRSEEGYSLELLVEFV